MPCRTLEPVQKLTRAYLYEKIKILGWYIELFLPTNIGGLLIMCFTFLVYTHYGVIFSCGIYASFHHLALTLYVYFIVCHPNKTHNMLYIGVLNQRCRKQVTYAQHMLVVQSPPWRVDASWIPQWCAWAWNKIHVYEKFIKEKYVYVLTLC